MKRTQRKVALMSAALVAIAIAARPASAQQPTLRAVLVHGEAVHSPRLLDGADTAACLWVATYSQYDGDTTPTAQAGPTVTLSFFTEDDWTRLIEEGGGTPDSLGVEQARFHTRLQLTQLGVQQPLGFRKALGAGPFTPRAHPLHPIGEVFLAARGVPTRVNERAEPLVRQFTEDEVAAIVPATGGWWNPAGCDRPDASAG